MALRGRRRLGKQQQGDEGQEKACHAAYVVPPLPSRQCAGAMAGITKANGASA